MDCTGDIDWYRIQLSNTPVKLEIVLTDIPEKSDFDIILYDSNLNGFEDGRSAQAGNADERISLIIDNSDNDSTDDSVDDSVVVFLQIHSFSGRGRATLIVTTEDVENIDEGTEDDGEEGPEQLTYEELLDTLFSFYPRGTHSGLLERSVETVTVEQITCQLSDAEVSGELTIGNYAHVERDLLRSIDYIDGWGLVVFNGSQRLFDMLKLTIRVTIFAPELDLEITVPIDMEINGNDYLTSKTENNVYFVSQLYGDFSGNSSDDIQVSSGVVGDIGDLFSNNIFTQQIEIEWQLEDTNGTRCSGKAQGEPIIDFQPEAQLFLY